MNIRESMKMILVWLCLIAVMTPLAMGEEQEKSYTFQANVMIPMRDGVKLAANLFIPKEGGPFPVILIRSPYDKKDEKAGEAIGFAERGYAVVYQDARGKFDSEGIWDPFRYDVEDGCDTLAWTGQQSWCNGKIATFGGSYVGFTQWALAPCGSPYLTAMMPIVPFTQAYYDTNYCGGALQLALMMGWGTLVSFKEGEKPPQIDWDKSFRQLPLKTWDDAIGREIFYLRDWVAHPTYDDYWKKRGIDGRYEDVAVPILNVGGWYDIFSKITLEQIANVRHRSKNLLARRNQFAIVGPWGHGVNQTKLGELEFGQSAKIEMSKLQDDWYGYWLKNEETGVENWPPYRLYVMGENVWRNENEWPLARTQYTNYYLHSQGKANTSSGNGALYLAEPEMKTADSFVYDPDNPVPTKGGNNLFGAAAGPFDQQEIEKRDDVLVYTTLPLTQEVEATGPVKMILYASSTAKDTDFTAKLVDVHPDGKAFNLCDGILRARYRNSSTDLELIEPGKIYKYEIDMWATSNLFLEGHCIRLEISSSNFPRFDRNPNSGQPFGTDKEVFKATQTIYHDAEHPSHLILPVIPR
ncbi:MAG: CocE/NonD family hydrolase [Candidatus Omnitrophota bacterium]